MAVTSYYSVRRSIIAERSTSRVDYLHDALSNITTTTDVGGNATNRYRFKPYGTRLSKTGSAPDPKFQWVGRLGYRTSSLQQPLYVRARHYMPSNGMWNSSDPYWPQECRFCYVDSSPITFVDPEGLQHQNHPFFDQIEQWAPGTLKPCPQCGAPLDCNSFPGGPCEFAKQMGHDYGDSGGVVCCGMIKYACRWAPAPFPGLKECTKKHEFTHFDDVYCADCGYDRPGWIPGINTNAEECEGFKVGFDCRVKNKRRDCGQLSGQARQICLDAYTRELCRDCGGLYGDCVPGGVQIGFERKKKCEAIRQQCISIGIPNPPYPPFP